MFWNSSIPEKSSPPPSSSSSSSPPREPVFGLGPEKSVLWQATTRSVLLSLSGPENSPDFIRNHCPECIHSPCCPRQHFSVGYSLLPFKAQMPPSHWAAVTWEVLQQFQTCEVMRIGFLFLKERPRRSSTGFSTLRGQAKCIRDLACRHRQENWLTKDA